MINNKKLIAEMFELSPIKNREVLFRFYSFRTQKMYQLSLHETTRHEGYLVDTVYAGESVPYERGNEVGQTRVQNLTDGVRMEYTGVKDKNDKHIYEGDYLNLNEHNSIGLVKFIHGSFVVEFNQRYVNISDISHMCTVAGNYFENPVTENEDRKNRGYNVPKEIIE